MMTYVCVVGLGTVGLPTAMHISKYHEVIGYDIDLSKVENARNHFSAVAEWSKVPKTDVYVICVNTWWREFPDMSAVQNVACKIAEKSTEKTLVTIESTVLPGTCRHIYETIFHKQVRLANCPHRFWPKDPIHYGIQQKRALGAANNESMIAAEKFYNSIKIPLHPMSSLEASEISKIVENTYRYIEIAYAEELALTCEKHGLDFNEIRQACNTLKRKGEGWQVQIMEAKEGISGTCLPKDIMYLHYLSNPSNLLEGAIKTDEHYRSHRKRRLVEIDRCYLVS